MFTGAITLLNPSELSDAHDDVYANISYTISDDNTKFVVGYDTKNKIFYIETSSMGRPGEYLAFVKSDGRD